MTAGFFVCAAGYGQPGPQHAGLSPSRPPSTEEAAMSETPFLTTITACNACATACDECVSGCLLEEDAQYMALCIQLDLDCAGMCRLAASALARQSPAVGVICETCARVCDLCAEECARHDMDHCQLCASACRDCAEACRRASAAGG
ncbi:four-helix bundle copper-binding protein [Uliginosibacterium sp. sgz301328]|uniref:four-helix bundle copper-binding protein n=1 Tax=Uliginosibacterium sp. sgz301328 TaxID=3243764 RepID=UPI00359E7AA5